MFLFAASALAVFAVLQWFNGYAWIFASELSASVLLFLGAMRLDATPYLQRWIYTFLILLFAFFLAIMLLPDASVAAFVWVLMMPVLAYLLLGRREGMILSVPFMLAGGVVYYLYLGGVQSASGMIDLLNLTLCGILMQIFMHMYELRREEAEQKLVELARTDTLTGLANRSAFQSTLARTIAEGERSGTGFALVVMDIDHFKAVNDTFGHNAGDIVLRHIGRCLAERLRTTDYVGRLGGEEFGLILRDAKPAAAYELMDELRQRIARQQLTCGGANISVTASFGIAQWPEHGREAETLFSVADGCLYSSKRAGRNRIAPAALAPRAGQTDTVAGGAA
ncbi:hypothetical protein Q666_03490 [Marinobacter sp. ES-1]|nr:hypothetical protein Q666_03490 [Marinobacter sp. ES-1]